jgi:ADP-ribose pyrophosphatase YjhB (NUDIX family)
MASYCCVLPFAIAEMTAHVLLARRNLIQKRENSRPIRGVIPAWAGHWGLILTEVLKGETPEAAGLRAFQEQTGIDPTDQHVVMNFVLGNKQVVKLETDNYTAFDVLCLFTTSDALSLLAESIQGLLNSNTPLEDTLNSVAVFPINKARQQLGAVLPPPKGWQGYLIQNYYGGTPPSQLNMEIGVLTTALTASAKQDNSFFVSALSATAPH